jgi:hypothetical protein
MLATIEIIQTLVAPVVMVSANGLLCLAFYNRLAAVVTRGRAINKERVELLTQLATLTVAEKQFARAVQIRRRMGVLDYVSAQLLHRAQWVRRVLYCLLLSVLSMLACSLTLGLSALIGSFTIVAPVLFVIGTLVMMAGSAIAMWELHLALEPLLFETESTGVVPSEESAALEEVES